ncbi:glycosyltransferase family 39 protein, partial [Candidatus Roizmanbacteria bacterium]|nr:glycosyltransferase family 39 protein [Candidatus Roizmanbacteria bacterium]
NKKLLFIFVLSFLLRLIALNQSLWLDEGTTAKVIQLYSFVGIVTKFSLFDFHPPLYYLFMKIWTNIFGYSGIALRMPSVIFSLLTGLVVYKIGEIIKDKQTGLWAAIFFLFNPLIIYYSQEARMYMLSTFFLTGALLYVIKTTENPKDQYWKNMILFNLFSILSFYTFYGSAFLIASFFIYFSYKKQYRLFFISLIFHLISLIIISPLLIQQFIHARQSLQIVMNWEQVLGTVTLKNVVLIPLKFSSGRISFEPKIFYYLICGIWAFLVWFFVMKGGAKNRLFLFLMIAPLAIGFIFSFFSPLLQYFRFLYLIPLMSLLLVISDKQLLYDRAKVIIVCGFIIFSISYLFIPKFHREDWKSLALSLRNIQTVYMISPSSDALKYYSPQIIVKELRTLEGIELEKQIVMVPYTVEIYGFDYKKELMKRGFTFKEVKTFRGLWYEVWVKNKDYAFIGSFRHSFITAKT